MSDFGISFHTIWQLNHLLSYFTLQPSSWSHPYSGTSTQAQIPGDWFKIFLGFCCCYLYCYNFFFFCCTCLMFVCTTTGTSLWWFFIVFFWVIYWTEDYTFVYRYWFTLYHAAFICWWITITDVSFSWQNIHIGVVVRMLILDTKVAGSNLSINMFSPWARDFIRIASVDSAVKWVPGGDNLVKGVQCYELFGGIALKNHTFSYIYIYLWHDVNCWRGATDEDRRCGRKFWTLYIFYWIKVFLK